MRSEPRWLAPDDIIELNQLVVAALVFLKINGWKVRAQFDNRLGDPIIDALTDTTRRPAFCTFLRDALEALAED